MNITVLQLVTTLYIAKHTALDTLKVKLHNYGKLNFYIHALYKNSKLLYLKLFYTH